MLAEYVINKWIDNKDIANVVCIECSYSIDKPWFKYIKTNNY